MKLQKNIFVISLFLIGLVISCQNKKTEISKYYSAYLNAYIIDTVQNNIQLIEKDKIILYKGYKSGEYKIGIPLSPRTSKMFEKKDSGNVNACMFLQEADTDKVNLILDTCNLCYNEEVFRYVFIENQGKENLYIGKGNKAFLLLENYEENQWIPADTLNGFLCGVGIQDIILLPKEIAICKINIKVLKASIKYRFSLQMYYKHYISEPFFR